MSRNLSILLFVLLFLSGCTAGEQFTKGFFQQATREAVNFGVTELDKKFGDKIGGLSEVLKGIKEGIPKPPAPEEGGIWSGLGALLAIIGAGAARSGYNRWRGNEKTE